MIIFTVVRDFERKSLSLFNCSVKFGCSESFDISITLHQFITR